MNNPDQLYFEILVLHSSFSQAMWTKPIDILMKNNVKEESEPSLDFTKS